MKKNWITAVGLALALALPGAALAQRAKHGTGEGEGAPMIQGGMTPEAMREMMRPMMQDMMREMMKETEAGQAAPSEAAPGPGHGAAHAAQGEKPAGSAATEAYRAANLAMHEAMDIEFSDNADIDFARGMIGHHQGAIEMARIVLEHGEDPELRQLAEEVVEAQEAEIAFLQEWIAKNAQ